MAKNAPGSKPRSIDNQNRVVLPLEVMRALNVKPQDYITFEIDGTDVRVYKIEWSRPRR